MLRDRDSRRQRREAIDRDEPVGVCAQLLEAQRGCVRRVAELDRERTDRIADLAPPRFAPCAVISLNVLSFI